MTEVTHKINDYVYILCQDGGKPYDFPGKDGKQVKGVSKETIKLVTPYSSVKLKPAEAMGLITASKNKELVSEIQRRMNQA